MKLAFFSFFFSSKYSLLVNIKTWNSTTVVSLYCIGHGYNVRRHKLRLSAWPWCFWGFGQFMVGQISWQPRHFMECFVAIHCKFIICCLLLLFLTLLEWGKMYIYWFLPLSLMAKFYLHQIYILSAISANAKPYN